MTAPTVAGTPTSGNDSTNVQNHVITLPTGIQVGELLKVKIVQDGTLTMTWPAGWTQKAIQAGTGITLEIRCRIADGTEGSTITVTTATNEAVSWQAERITGWYGSDLTNSIIVGTPVTGSSTTPDPPSVTAPWGTADNLFETVIGWGSSVSNISAYPSSYTSNQLTDDDSNANIAGIASATRSLASATDDPGTATLSVSDSWVAVTFVIRPAAAGDVSVTPAPATGKGASVNPGVLLGSLSLSPAAAIAKGAIVAPTAILGSLSISPAARTVRGAGFAPSVVLGSLVIAPAAQTGRSSSAGPTVQLGSLVIMPAAVTFKGVTIDPFVIGGGNLIVVPSAATVKGLTVGLSLVLGSIILSPVSRSVRAFAIDPTVQVGSGEPPPDDAIRGLVIRRKRNPREPLANLDEPLEGLALKKGTRKPLRF